MLLMFICMSATVFSQSTDMDFATISGFTEPYRSIEVAAGEMGTLAHVDVVEGQTVKSGDILAKLNEDVYEASLGMAKEKLEAKGRRNSAEAELNMQQDRYWKLVGLQQRGNASQIEVNRAKAQFDIAKASLESVEDDSRIANFEFQRAKAQLELRRLRSPIDGVVTRVHKEMGEFVSANDPVVVSVVQLNPLKSIFSVPQSAVRQLKSGDQVDIQVGRESELALGVVEFVSPTTDAQSGTRRVTVKIENGDGQWQSGDVCVLKLANEPDGGQRNASFDGLAVDQDFSLVKATKDDK